MKSFMLAFCESINCQSELNVSEENTFDNAQLQNIAPGLLLCSSLLDLFLHFSLFGVNPSDAALPITTVVPLLMIFSDLMHAAQVDASISLSLPALCRPDCSQPLECKVSNADTGPVIPVMLSPSQAHSFSRHCLGAQ